MRVRGMSPMCISITCISNPCLGSYVLANHFVFSLSEQPPGDMAALLSMFSSVPPILRRKAGDLLAAIRDAMKIQTPDKPENDARRPSEQPQEHCPVPSVEPIEQSKTSKSQLFPETNPSGMLVQPFVYCIALSSFQTDSCLWLRLRRYLARSLEFGHLSKSTSTSHPEVLCSLKLHIHKLRGQRSALRRSFTKSTVGWS